MAAEPAVSLGRITLTEQQMAAARILLYRSADLIDRLLVDNHIQYTKIAVPYPQIQGVAGQLPPASTPQASEIAPRSPRILQGG